MYTRVYTPCPLLQSNVLHGEREKLVDIWFVLRILEFEVNFGNFICVTYVLYVSLVENSKFAVRVCLVEQVARTSNRKTVSCNIP